MKLGILAGVLFAAACTSSHQAGRPPGPVAPAAAWDLLLVGGRVYTGDLAHPWAEAIAIRGDQVAAVGASAALRARVERRGSSTSVGGS